LPLYAALLISHGVLNHVGVRVVSKLNTVSAWYHLVGVGVLVVALVAFAPRHPLSFLLQQTTIAPQGLGMGFLLGLLQAAWTFTGYDASAHVSEETVDPSRLAPRGIILSVAVSGIVGWLMLGAVTLAIADLPQTVAAANPFLFVLKGALGALGDALVWMVMGAMWFCGLASITSNSRMLFAFARDGGLPMSARIASVSPRFQSPHVAVWVSVVAAFIVAIWADAYSAMTALSTIALYASYGLPIAVGLRARRAGIWKQPGPWTLGRWSSVVNVIALAWCAALTVLFVLPPNEMAGYTFFGTCALLLLAWFAGVRKRFAGPKVTLALL
jgi:amino acid transporter